MIGIGSYDRYANKCEIDFIYEPISQDKISALLSTILITGTTPYFIENNKGARVALPRPIGWGAQFSMTSVEYKAAVDGFVVAGINLPGSHPTDSTPPINNPTAAFFVADNQTHKYLLSMSTPDESDPALNQTTASTAGIYIYGFSPGIGSFNITIGFTPSGHLKCSSYVAATGVTTHYYTSTNVRPLIDTESGLAHLMITLGIGYTAANGLVMMVEIVGVGGGKVASFYVYPLGHAASSNVFYVGSLGTNYHGAIRRIVRFKGPKKYYPPVLHNSKNIANFVDDINLFASKIDLQKSDAKVTILGDAVIYKYDLLFYFCEDISIPLDIETGNFNYRATSVVVDNRTGMGSVEVIVDEVSRFVGIGDLYTVDVSNRTRILRFRSRSLGSVSASVLGQQINDTYKTF